MRPQRAQPSISARFTGTRRRRVSVTFSRHSARPIHRGVLHHTRPSARTDRQVARPRGRKRSIQTGRSRNEVQEVVRGIGQDRVRRADVCVRGHARKVTYLCSRSIAPLPSVIQLGRTPCPSPLDRVARASQRCLESTRRDTPGVSRVKDRTDKIRWVRREPDACRRERGRVLPQGRRRILRLGIEGRSMLAAVGGFGIVGVLVVVLIVIVIIYFVRRG